MSCISVNVDLLRAGVVGIEAEKLGCVCSKFERIKSNASVSIGLICAVGVGRSEYLACSDLGYIRTYDRGYIILARN